MKDDDIFVFYFFFIIENYIVMQIIFLSAQTAGPAEYFKYCIPSFWYNYLSPANNFNDISLTDLC